MESLPKDRAEVARNVIVLGAGVSGLAVGWRLSAAGMPVDLLEASSQVGGLAGTIREDGYCLDFGPHSFFSEDPKVRQAVLDLFNPPLTLRYRSVKFLYNGRYLDYPLTAANVLLRMGPGSGARAVLSFLKGRWAARGNGSIPLEEQSVEDWARANFGEHLYRTFFKPYTEQFWKIPCPELSARSIPTHTRMSFTKALRHLWARRPETEGLSLLDRERLPTYYPETGYGEICERIAQIVRGLGGRIHLNRRVTRVSRWPGGGFRITAVRDGLLEEREGSHIISTLPLPLLIRMLEPTPPQEVLQAAQDIDYRPLVMLGMVTERQDVLTSSYLYLLDRPYNRITEMNKFSPATSPPGENIVAVEIPCQRDSPTWRASKEELFDRCIGHLEADRVLSASEVGRLLLVKAPYAYPIYRKGYAQHLRQVLNYLEQCPGLTTLGRSGEFMYGDADQCIRRAFDLADQLLDA